MKLHSRRYSKNLSIIRKKTANSHFLSPYGDLEGNARTRFTISWLVSPRGRYHITDEVLFASFTGEGIRAEIYQSQCILMNVVTFGAKLKSNGTSPINNFLVP